VKPAFQVSWFAGVRMSKSGGLGRGMGGVSTVDRCEGIRDIKALGVALGIC
jgi:hypothetical protein